MLIMIIPDAGLPSFTLTYSYPCLATIWHLDPIHCCSHQCLYVILIIYFTLALIGRRLILHRSSKFYTQLYGWYNILLSCCMMYHFWNKYIYLSISSTLWLLMKTVRLPALYRKFWNCTRSVHVHDGEQLCRVSFIFKSTSQRNEEKTIHFKAIIKQFSTKKVPRCFYWPQIFHNNFILSHLRLGRLLIEYHLYVEILCFSRFVLHCSNFSMHSFFF